MLYCLCYDSWENDSQRIEQMSTILLLEGMHNSVSSIQELRSRLKTILQRLNRRAKYAPIANAIYKECQVLYPDVDSPDVDSQISMPGTAGVDEATSENTQINVRKKSDERWVAPKASAQQPISKPIRIRSSAVIS